MSPSKIPWVKREQDWTAEIDLIDRVLLLTWYDEDKTGNAISVSKAPLEDSITIESLRGIDLADIDTFIIEQTALSKTTKEDDSLDVEDWALQ